MQSKSPDELMLNMRNYVVQVLIDRFENAVADDINKESVLRILNEYIR